MTKVNNVTGVINYVIAARPSLLNFMIADRWIPQRPPPAHIHHLRTLRWSQFAAEDTYGSEPQTSSLPLQPGGSCNRRSGPEQGLR
jgi:hypothetical protein